MRKALAIAHYTFREAARNKVLYSIVFFALILVVLTIVLGAASMDQDTRVITDVGLLVIQLFSDLIAIFLGLTMLYNELERKTIYNLLSKPISRHSYFLGKYLGLVLTLLVQFVFMSLVFALVLHLRGDGVDLSFVQALIAVWMRACLVAAIALFFSSFSTPYVAGFMTLGVWLVGNLLQTLQGYLHRIESELTTRLLEGIIVVAPDLNLFTLTTQVTYGIEIPWTYLLQAFVYALGYALAFLGAGALIFRERDFI